MYYAVQGVVVLSTERPPTPIVNGHKSSNQNRFETDGSEVKYAVYTSRVGIAKKWRLTPAVSIYIVLTGFTFKVLKCV